jgi:N-acetyl-gamma-glutamyl-phosphate reductase
MKIKIGIVGGTGYTGVELLRLLLRHPNAELTAITSRTEAGKPVADLFPNLRGHLDLCYTEPNLANLRNCEVVFFATPHATAMYSAPELLQAGIKVIDLSADFRIQDIALWEQWYQVKHACPEVVINAVYGLPELNRNEIANAQLIACPGCYPTAMQLALLPLLSADLVDTNDIIVDAKSGVSGAGRKAAIGGLMSEVGESFKAYAASGHRHFAETVESLNRVAHRPVRLTFIPHLLPMIRGIHATVYVNLTKSDVSLQQIFTQYYNNEAFVDVLPPGSHPETRAVRGTNKCQLAIHSLPGGKVVILAVIDNLVKGAAGQAVQNMNIAFNLPEISGLMDIGLLP